MAGAEGSGSTTSQRSWRAGGVQRGRREDRREERACADPARPPSPQNASRDLLGEALAQHIRQQIDARGDHPLSRYSLAGAWGHGTGTAHVSVLGPDGSAVAATSTINTPCVSPEAGGQAPLLPPRPESLPPHPTPPSAWLPAPASPHLAFPISSSSLSKGVPHPDILLMGALEDTLIGRTGGILGDSAGAKAAARQAGGQPPERVAPGMAGVARG